MYCDGEHRVGWAHPCACIHAEVIINISVPMDVFYPSSSKQQMPLRMGVWLSLYPSDDLCSARLPTGSNTSLRSRPDEAPEQQVHLKDLDHYFHDDNNGRGP